MSSRAERKARRDQSVTGLLRARHRELHPDCTFSDEPHFVPPSAGMSGFFMCEHPAPVPAEGQEQQ